MDGDAVWIGIGKAVEQLPAEERPGIICSYQVSILLLSFLMI